MIHLRSREKQREAERGREKQRKVTNLFTVLMKVSVQCIVVSIEGHISRPMKLKGHILIYMLSFALYDIIKVPSVETIKHTIQMLSFPLC